MTVTVALPMETPVTTPSLTVATDSSEDVQVNLSTVASSGTTVTERATGSPMTR